MINTVFGITLGEVVSSSTGLLTPDVLHLMGFPKIVIAESYRGSFGSQYISEQAAKWCNENGIVEFVNSHDVFWFNNQEDAVMFKLRWG